MTGEPKPAKYLAFQAGGESFALPVAHVREIVSGLRAVTPLPGAPDCVKGLINLRGCVLPVIDLRAGLGLGRAAGGEPARPCIIVMQTGRALAGALVDEVTEVFSAGGREIEQAESFGRGLPGLRCVQAVLAVAEKAP